MTDKKLLELLVVIDNHYGRIRSKDERKADTQIYIRAFGTIPDEIVEKALYTAFTQCRFQNQLIVDWCAEIKKLLSAQQPSANDLWAQAAAAARKIEANLYYQTHGGFIAPDGRKLKGEDFKKENVKIFAALPMVVQRWAGSPADLSEIFSSRSPSRWALPPRASANSGREPLIILAMFRSARAFLRAATMISRFWTMPMIFRSNRGKGVVGW